MKQYLKTICVGNFYYYYIYKIVDAVGRVYYVAEPKLNGATRCAETEELLKKILERDVDLITQFQQKTR